jgi:ATP phosphoribosyltransferase regulatory subunit
MTSAKRWILPDGVEEILPAEAHKLESLRRQIMDLYESWGYQLVITPLIEYLDSLLVGSSSELELHTFKIIDQLSGRMMGIRADITPQAARIDAHCLNREGPVRLCYADSVLHTKPQGLLTSRVPIRIGAELYGHAGIECDIELICLMHATLQAVGISGVHIVMGHVGLFRSLVEAAELDQQTQRILFDAVQRKAFDECDAAVEAAVKDENLRELLQRLVRLSGDASVLDEAKAAFKTAPDAVKREFDDLLAVVAGITKRIPKIVLCFDLCELRGYEYHTGIVFAAYTPEHGKAVAKGGRYDHIGEVFGRARPASGFDSDLKTLARLTSHTFSRRAGILAPLATTPDLIAEIARLREDGEIVVESLTSEPLAAEAARELDCGHRLVNRKGKWKVEAL